jgi:GNAT superfamily N-acetyltransferase
MFRNYLMWVRCRRSHAPGAQRFFSHAAPAKRKCDVRGSWVDPALLSRNAVSKASGARQTDGTLVRRQLFAFVKGGSIIVLQVEVRRALPGEAGNLSALALRSKGLWGYDGAFMEACPAPLTADPEAIAKYPFYVLDERGTITGFYGLGGQPPRAELEFLFVEPERVRRGRGQRLARHFLALARSLGFEEMDVFG